MQHDQLIWETIQKACAFKRLFSERLFCRNEYNVTGLCNRASCPLANSRYATVREEQARCYLYVKSVERAHTPKSMWVKIKLSRNYQKALKQIESELEYWPEITIHKNKQRLTKIFQYLLRIKKLSALPRPKLVPLQRNVEKVDRRREARAETVARIDNAIEDELLKRLQSGTYGDIYNFPMQQYNKALEREVKKAREVDLNVDEFEEAYEGEELESQREDEQEIECLNEEDFEESDDDIEDIEGVLVPSSVSEESFSDASKDDRRTAGKSQTKTVKREGSKRKKPRIELELEEELLPASEMRNGPQY